MKEPGAAAGFLRGGAVEGITAERARGQGVEDAFFAAAKDASDGDPATFVSSLDDAVAELKNHPGLRVAVAILEPTALSSETEESLKQIIDFASANSVRVVVMDPSNPPQEGSGDIWKQLASATGGALVHQARALDGALVSIAGGTPTFKTEAEPVEPVSAPAASLASDIPVKVRFIQVSNRSSNTSSSTMATVTDTGVLGGRSVGESASREESTGPLHGWLIVEAPLSAVQFKEDDKAGVYYARFLVTESVRNADGKVVWSAKKDVSTRGPLDKLRERRAGNVYYMRDVVLQSGRYSLEATVDDQLAGKKGAVRIPLRTGANVPGLVVSDAMLVKPFHPVVDKFEADMVLNYQGNALAPLIEPVFPANSPFKVEMYFIIYPDIYGAQPDITLEVLQDGKAISRGSMPFKTPLRTLAQEGKGTSVVGELQHGFDYMASMNVEKFSAGDYEARVTVRQSRNVVTRSAMFHVRDQAATPAGHLAERPSK